MDKVKFYSITNLGIGYQLKKAEGIIESYNKSKEYNIHNNKYKSYILTDLLLKK